MSDSLQSHGLYSPWNSAGQNTGVGSLSLLQGIFPTQGSNPGLPHFRQILYHLSHKGSPRILEWVAYPFSSGSSLPRNRAGVSCITDNSLSTELSEKPCSLLWLSNIPLCIYAIFCIFIYPLMDIWVVSTSGSHEHVLKSSLWISSVWRVMYLVLELLSHMVILYFLLRNCTQF